MHAPHCPSADAIGQAQVVQRSIGCAKRSTQGSQTGSAGQRWHTAQRPGTASDILCSSERNMPAIYPAPAAHACMTSELPPSIDPIAAHRWAQRTHAASPWLHEEVGRRMQDRLQWIKQAPQAWADWAPALGGLQAHKAVAQRYPAARCHVVESVATNAELAVRALRKPWWGRAPFGAAQPVFGPPPEAGVQMVWSNMALHMAADPQALIALWQRWLAVDGFLMFSCLGPDTLRGLREACQANGWPAPAHDFTDMHDWGDMLVNSGFAEPVMDMERITLTFDSSLRAMRELRELGRNLHTQRFAGLRTRRWRDRLGELMASGATVQSDAPGAVSLTFEIIYGHAIKAAPRISVKSETVLSLQEMRRVLAKGQAAPGSLT
jgi:malonyl-CoA O-methyltransferase